MGSKIYQFVTLSKEQWKIVLSRLDRNSTIFKIINVIYESEKHTSNATTIAEIIGLSNYHFPTMAVVNFGKQIYREYKNIVNFPKSHRNKSKIRYWQIVFDGNQSKRFDRVMKKEMLAAIDSLNLFSEDENYIKEAVAIYQDITCFEEKERQSIVKIDENIQLQLTDECKSYMRYHFNRFKNGDLSCEND